MDIHIPHPDAIEYVAKDVCLAMYQGWPDDSYNGRQQRRYYRDVARMAIMAYERFLKEKEERKNKNDSS